jgi:predicted oxidoreductase
MQRIKLCTGGPECSRVVYGWWRLADWQLSSAEIQQQLESCIELGVTTHDHADIYGDYTCEAMFGEALGRVPRLREKIELISKCGIRLISANRPGHKVKSYDTCYQHIVSSAEQSLQNLQTDYLDILLIHRPDPLMNADEIARAFAALLESGKVRHFGVSNFTPWQFDLLQTRLDFPLVTNQVEASVLHLEPFLDGTLDQCQQDQIAPMAWSSLAGGRLFSDVDEAAVRVRKCIQVIADRINVSLDQVALAWLLVHPANILPVVGSRSVDRLKSAVDATAVVAALTREDWYAIWQASSGREIP